MRFTSVEPQAEGSAQALTSLLTHAESDGLSSLDIVRLIRTGFLISDVQAMAATSGLHDPRKLVQRITGKSTRTAQRQRSANASIRLNASQSAVAFQYAKVIEAAISVFGSAQHAEAWLNKPCRYLSGIVPFDMIDNSFGFCAVMEYLDRVRWGVYQ